MDPKQPHLRTWDCMRAPWLKLACVSPLCRQRVIHTAGFDSGGSWPQICMHAYSKPKFAIKALARPGCNPPYQTRPDATWTVCTLKIWSLIAHALLQKGGRDARRLAGKRQKL
eukprot:scaffold202086_cov19-Tisochrysis_lutea.AAC.1